MRCIGLAVALTVSLLVGPLPAEPQQEKVYRVGVLLQGSPPPPGSPPGVFSRALREFGYIPGRNILLDWRWAEGRNERFSSLATELISLKPDVIVADTTAGLLAAKHATATIPIVMVQAADPVGSGLVASLARPGGNVTGAANLESELLGKAVELLHTVAPKATRVAVLMSDYNPLHPSQLTIVQGATRGFGLTVLPTMVRSPEDFEGAFRSMAKQKAARSLSAQLEPVFIRTPSDFDAAFKAVRSTDGLLVLESPFFTTYRSRLVELAATSRLPAIYGYREMVDVGGLMSYGTYYPDVYRRAAIYVDRIFQGAKPADLPVEQPTTFELVINLKTAKALGLTIPQSLLLRADQIID